MRKTLTVVFFLAIIAACAYVAVKLHQDSREDKKLKADFFTVNQIKYGILSGDKWTGQVSRIISMQIDSFNFTPSNRKILKKQVSNILLRLVDEADTMLHERQDKLSDRIKFSLIRGVVNLDKVRERVPKFSESILAELDKNENRTALKKILKQKVSDILGAACQDTLHEQQAVIRLYGMQDMDAFNQHIFEKTEVIKGRMQVYGYVLIGCLLLVLLMWIYVYRHEDLYASSFLFSVIISFIALVVGVSLPMIEIDARIAMMDLHLLKSHIIFKDQVIFFQTKSIIDVIRILLTQGKADSILVGVLILMFSVLFPVTKLISITIYLFNHQRGNRFIHYMSFKSGKWSMADVMVIAIFMAYVGFDGILDDQLADITVHTDPINMLTTNRTTLQTGFVIFVSFVLFNLALAELLKKITSRKNKA